MAMLFRAYCRTSVSTEELKVNYTSVGHKNRISSSIGNCLPARNDTTSAVAPSCFDHSSVELWKRGVSTGPGAYVFTAMPCDPSSCANAYVRDRIAVFDAQ
ncbi:hypothetical protein BDR05DRAFT_958137 [Suillus weaverae]|nr:hypothetical protein BDR05DRAFT_958137 [Suillus weaverae]